MSNVFEAPIDAVAALMREVAEKTILPRYQSLADSEIVEKAHDDVVTIADRESEAMLAEGLAKILPDCGRPIRDALPADLPEGTIHADLFPDNVLFVENRVTGLIDFYFACTGAFAFDVAVLHAAWSFALADNAFRPAIGSALIAGYESRRSLSEAEHAALPVLAQAACLRFVATRVEDWFATPDSGLVRRKDPMEFAHRLAFYARSGDAPFQ